MTSITLKKLFKKESRPVLEAVLLLVDEPLLILDADGSMLLGTPEHAEPGGSGEAVGGLPSPVEHEGQILGWVAGKKGSQWPSSIATMLAFLLDQEAGKKALAGETLDRYRELHLLYRLSERLAAAPQPEAIAQMTLNEVCPLLQVKGGMILLMPEGGKGLKVISACGSPHIFKPEALLSDNIVGRVLQTAAAELSNNRDAGELFENGKGIPVSLLCAPLKTEKGAIGAILMVGDGSRQFTAGDLKLLNAIAMQTAPAIEIARLHQFELAKAQLEHDLQMAYQVQSGLLPGQMPVVEGWRLAAFWRPARGVSGDFYDFIHFPDGRLGLVIADVSDKGVPAALVMANTRSLLRAVAANATRRKHLSPGEILARANNLLCKDMPMNMFVTCQMAVLDPKNGQVCVANAGHNLPLRRGASSVVELRPTGLPLGLFSGMVYDEVEISLGFGDSLLMYSDGLVEAHNPRGDMFGTERLRKFLAPQTGLSPLQGEELIQYLLARLADFTGPEWEQEDDVTFVTLERLAKS